MVVSGKFDEIFNEMEEEDKMESSIAKLVNLDDGHPTITIVALDDKVHVVPKSVFDDLIDDKLLIGDVDGGEIIVRTILAEWLSDLVSYTDKSEEETAQGRALTQNEVKDLAVIRQAGEDFLKHIATIRSHGEYEKVPHALNMATVDLKGAVSWVANHITDYGEHAEGPPNEQQ